MGGDGESAKNIVQETPATLKKLQDNAMNAQSPEIQQLLSDYGSGKISLKDALAAKETYSTERAAGRQKYIDDNWNAMQGQYGVSPLDKALYDSLNASQYDNETNQSSGKYSNLEDLLSTSAASADRFHTDRLRENPLTSGILGEGGLQERLSQEGKDLEGKGFQLQQEDHEAYGQASGDIARLFGQQEADVAQSLASRGLAAAPSGAAGVAYSGLAGNKNEQLAKMQLQIADKRMQNTTDRLNKNRQMQLATGEFGQNAMSNSYNRALSGRQQNNNELAQASGQATQNLQAQQNQLNTQFEQEQASKGPGLGEILGTIGGTALGAVTGGVGTALGSTLGSSLGKKIGG